MGYSKHKNAVRRVAAFLDQMVSANNKIEFPSDDPRRLSNIIFEGINTSKRFASEEPYNSYSKLGAKFKIRLKKDHVLCEPREVSLLTKTQSLAQVTLPHLQTDLEVIGAAIQHKAPIMIFPDALAANKKPIYNWAIKNNYLVIVREKELVLTVDQSEKEIAWSPSS